MSSSLDHKCQRCGSQYHGQVCPFCTITGLDVNALLASEGLTLPQPESAQAASTEPAHALLVDVVSTRTFPVSAPICRFGRDISNDIVLTGDKSLSRFHFQITFNNGEFFVEDAGSRNGTFLNGSPVTSPRKVLNGDIISAGMSRYRLVGSEDELPKNGDAPPMAVAQAAPTGQAYENIRQTEEAPKIVPSPLANTLHDDEDEAPAVSTESGNVDTGAHEAMPELAAEAQAQPEPQMYAQPDPQIQAQPEPYMQEEPQMQMEAQPEPQWQAQPEAQMQPKSAGTATSEYRMPRVPAGNQPVDVASSSVESLLPASKEDELTDTASRFLKLAQNPQDALWPEGKPHEINDQEAARAQGRRDQRQWPAWCNEFSFGELDELREKAKTIEGEIAAKQVELDQLNDVLGEAEGMKNRLLATHDSEMVEACAAVFNGLGWQTELNAGSTDELVLSADGTAVAIAKVVCTEAQPKPNVLAHLVSSLSNYWSEHGVEPKGILVVAFTSDGPLHDRPELGKDLSDYANKKNVCLMNSLQLLAIYRESTLCHADVESIQSILLLASGMLQGYEITATTAAT